MLRRAESAARGFALSGDQGFATEYRAASEAILPALDALIEAVKDNPTEKRLIEETKALVERQIAVNGELIRLRTAGDGAAIAALVSQEDRAATAAIAGNLEKAVAEERRLLFARRAESETNGSFLLAIDLAGVALILILATALTVSDPPLAPRTAGFAERHPGHQRGAGGRGRRAHRASGRRPCRNSGIRPRCCRAPFTAWRRRCSSSTPRERSCSPTRPRRRCFATGPA